MKTKIFLIAGLFSLVLFAIIGCNQTEAPTSPTTLVEQSLQKSSDRDNGRLRFKARLSGDEEVPPVMTDTRGNFEVKFNSDTTAAKFELRVQDGVAITQAHFHCAPAGVNGPVIAFLFGMIPGGFDVDGKLAEFTLTDANIAAVGADCVPTIGMAITDLVDLVQAIQDTNIYVNVHSVANPPGEIRGQVLRDRDKDDDDDDDDRDRDKDRDGDKDRDKDKDRDRDKDRDKDKDKDKDRDKDKDKDRDKGRDKDGDKGKDRDE